MDYCMYIGNGFNITFNILRHFLLFDELIRTKITSLGSSTYRFVKTTFEDFLLSNSTHFRNLQDWNNSLTTFQSSVSLESYFYSYMFGKPLE